MRYGSANQYMSMTESCVASLNAGVSSALSYQCYHTSVIYPVISYPWHHQSTSDNDNSLTYFGYFLRKHYILTTHLLIDVW